MGTRNGLRLDGDDNLMFYCDECAAKRNYPITFTKSHGGCELCRKIARCNDLPTHQIITFNKDFTQI